MNHWKIVKSIYDKVVAKCPQGTLNSNKTKSPATAYSLRIIDRCSFDERKGTQFRLVSPNYTTACMKDSSEHSRFLNFNTDVERYNAWQSYLTKFARFCICMDESTKLAPYMGNYTQPWDDQRFYTYFGLTQPEIQLIETVIK